MCDDKSSFGTFCAEDQHSSLLGKQCGGCVFCPPSEGWRWAEDRVTNKHAGSRDRLMTRHSCQSSPQIGPQSARHGPRVWAISISSSASSHLTTTTLPLYTCGDGSSSCILLLLVAGTLLQLLYPPANGCSLSALPSLLLLRPGHTFVENNNNDHQPHLLSVSVLMIGAAKFHIYCGL